MIHATAFTLALLAAPEAGPEEPALSTDVPSDELPAETDDRLEAYREALASVRKLDEKINLGHPVGDELFSALTELNEFAPILAADTDARRERARAQLNLARLYLTQEKLERADAVMDEVIRSNIGEELPLKRMGPSIKKLHGQRLARFEELGTGAIDVNCQVDCQVYINERVAEEHTEGLYLGPYRVWVEAVDPQAGGAHHVEEIKLDETGQVLSIDFDPFPGTVADIDDETKGDPQPKRLLARGPEVAMIVLGAGALAGGSLLLGLSSGQRASVGIGATFVALGSASLIGGSVTLGIDEVRIGRWRGRQATLTWTTRF